MLCNNWEEFGLFWIGTNNVIASASTIITSLIIIFYMLFYSFVKIHCNQGNLNDPEIRSQLGVLTDGYKLYSYHSSMYNVYYLTRRVLTSIILVVFHEHPYFQASMLLVMSTINLIYTFSEKPFTSSKTNKIEVFNETCILICSYTTFMQVNVAYETSIKNFLGLAFIISGGINVFVNLVIIS